MATAVPTDRNGLEVLGLDECMDLLAMVPVGRVAFIAEGAPLIVPVNHAVWHGGVAFRSAPGSKLDAAIMERYVAFEVDGLDREQRVGWSVVVQGVAETIDDPGDVNALDALGMQPWSPHVSNGRWVRIRPDVVSGRRVIPAD